MRSIKTLIAVAALAASTALLSACGGVPADSVATVADAPIQKTEFNHWMIVASRTQGGVPTDFAFNPPDFDKCVAAKKLEASKNPNKKQAQPTEAQLKATCQSLFSQSMPQVMQLLIQSAWIKGQASEMGIEVSQAEVDKQFAATKKGAFPTDKAFQQFLKQSGESEADLKDRVLVNALAQKIRDKVIAQNKNVTDAQIQDWYDRNQSNYGKPEARDISVILTKDQAQANKAKAAVESGTSWADAAKQYSTDSATKDKGGVIKGAVKGQQDPAVDAAAFKGKQNVIIGPVKGAFGWYVVKVTKVTPANLKPISQVKAQIRQEVQSSGQQNALQKFVKDFQDTWKSRTDCAKYYIVELCKNAPTPKAPTGVPGATTQQTPPAGG